MGKQKEEGTGPKDQSADERTVQPGTFGSQESIDARVERRVEYPRRRVLVPDLPALRPRRTHARGLVGRVLRVIGPRVSGIKGHRKLTAAGVRRDVLAPGKERKRHGHKPLE